MGDKIVSKTRSATILSQKIEEILKIGKTKQNYKLK